MEDTRRRRGADRACGWQAAYPVARGSPRASPPPEGGLANAL